MDIPQKADNLQQGKKSPAAAKKVRESEQERVYRYDKNRLVWEVFL